MTFSQTMKVAAEHRFKEDETVQLPPSRSGKLVKEGQGISGLSDAAKQAAITVASDEEVFEHLLQRVGVLHLRQRLGLESDHHTFILAKNRKRLYIENWDAFPWLIRRALQMTFLYHRARRNALSIRLHHNIVTLPQLPAAFEGFKILHLSDLHADMNAEFAQVLCQRIEGLDYDACVLTGDYRYRTYGPAEPALQSLAQIFPALRRPVYAILGNHDSIRMVPAMERMGYRLLINEAVTLERDGSRLHVVGVDDPHYFRADNLDRACRDIDHDNVTILLAHTPEYYRHAAYAGFDFMMCGHTHGGQICLPGGVPLIYEAKCPRRLAAGAWRYRDLHGYTSVGAGSSIVDVRLNCLPEVTVHELRRA